MSAIVSSVDTVDSSKTPSGGNTRPNRTTTTVRASGGNQANNSSSSGLVVVASSLSAAAKNETAFSNVSRAIFHLNNFLGFFVLNCVILDSFLFRAICGGFSPSYPFRFETAVEWRAEAQRGPSLDFSDGEGRVDTHTLARIPPPPPPTYHPSERSGWRIRVFSISE